MKPTSEYNRNILKLLSGTTVAQAIPILISPILTRIYEPADFGVYAAFMSVVMILASVITFRYEAAIVLPKKDSEAINILALSIIIAFVLSFLLFILILIFFNHIVQNSNLNEIGLWVYFIPLGTFFIGLFNSLTFYNNRKKEYSNIAQVTILKSLILAVVQISVGLLKNGPSGLISGFMLAQFFSNSKLFFKVLSFKDIKRIFNKKKIFVLIKKYINFPKYSALSVLLNTSIQNMINILGSIFFGFITIGFYSLAQRVLGLPLVVISKSVGQVFLEKTIYDRRKYGNSIKIFESTLKKLLIIAIPLFLFIYLFIDIIVTFAFGVNWAYSSEIIKSLIPLFFVRFITVSLTPVLIAYEKQKSELIMNIILFSTTITTLLFFKDNFKEFLFYFNFFMTINYLLFLIYFHKLTKGRL